MMSIFSSMLFFAIDQMPAGNIPHRDSPASSSVENRLKLRGLTGSSVVLLPLLCLSRDETYLFSGDVHLWEWILLPASRI
jgi:hypothetical protein